MSMFNYKELQAIEGIKKTWLKNEYTTVPPVGCKFELGQQVRFTNENGVSFDLKILGFRCAVDDYLPGRDVFIFTDCYWYPAKISQIRPLSEVGQ